MPTGDDKPLDIESSKNTGAKNELMNDIIRTDLLPGEREEETLFQTTI